MKKTILFLVLSVFTFHLATAQTWTSLSTGDTQSVNSVYFINSDNGYMVTSIGKIFKTTDAGVNWNVVYNGTKELFAVHFTDLNTGFASGKLGIILKTNDGGVTWSEITWKNINSGNQPQLNSIYFTDNNTGYIVGGMSFDSTILKTTDKGNNWTRISLASSPISLNSISFSDINTGYIVGGEGTYLKTADAGKTWLPISIGTTQNLTSIKFISLNEGFIGGYGGTLLKTSDSGVSWKDISLSTIFAKNTPTPVFFTNSNTGYMGGLIANRNFSYSDVIVKKTTDGGNSWITINNDCMSLENDYKSILFTDSNNGYIFGSGRVIRTTNAGASFNYNLFGGSEPLRNVFFIDDNIGFAVGGLGDSIDRGCPIPNSIKKTINGGINWVNIGGQVPEEVKDIHFTTANIGFAINSVGLLYKTIDGGNKWDKIQGLIKYGALFDIFFVDKNVGYVAGVGDAILKTIDGGNTWAQLNLGTTNLIFSIYFLNAEVGFVSCNGGKILKTTDGGISWKTSFSVDVGGSSPIYSVFFTSANIGFCVVGNKLFRTSNLGITWIEVNLPIQNNWNSVYFVDDKIGFIGGGQYRILKTIDAGISWTVSKNDGYKEGRGAINAFNFPRVYKGYAVGDYNTVLKYETCNGFTANLSQTNVNCFDNNIGTASVTVKGGTAPYTYLWSNGKTTPTITGLSPGLYTVTVKMTGQECPITKSVTIIGPDAPLSGTITTTSNTKCSGVPDGSATINVTGGTAPYSYKWDALANNQITKTATNLFSAKYGVVVTDAKGCALSKDIVLPSTSNFNSQVYLTNIAAVDQVSVSPAFTAYYTYNLPAKITPNATNLRNFVDPGKKARFKVECTNKKTNGQSIVSGICEVRSNCPYITITDNSSALNNIGWNNKAWSADEFEIDIKPNTPAGTIAYIDFIVKENGIEYTTSCIPLPITPLNYSPTTEFTIDDDNNPDSKGNNNDLCEPNEIIEFYPWLDNVSTLNAEYVRGRFENLDNLSYINIWNNKAGVNTTVFDTTWWNFSFGQPSVINSNSVNTTPEYDFVFNYNNANKINNFKLYMVMAGGFKLFPGNALSLVQWTLPYTFNNGTLSSNDFLKDDSLMIYPNPTTNFVTIKVNPLYIGSRYTITDVLGKIVTSGKIVKESSNINMEQFVSGLYLFKIGGQSQQTFKIIKK